MSGVTIAQNVLQVVVTPQGQPAITLTVPAPPVVQIAPVGLQGPAGPAGDGVNADPGDFTLIFENQLI